MQLGWRDRIDGPLGESGDDPDSRRSQRRNGRVNTEFSIPDSPTGSTRPHESCRLIPSVTRGNVADGDTTTTLNHNHGLTALTVVNLKNRLVTHSCLGVFDSWCKGGCVQNTRSVMTGYPGLGFFSSTARRQAAATSARHGEFRCTGQKLALEWVRISTAFSSLVY